MRTLMSEAHSLGCSALAQGGKKGRWSLLLCSAPDPSVLATLLRGPERAVLWSWAELGSNPGFTPSSWIVAKPPGP